MEEADSRENASAVRVARGRDFIWKQLMQGGGGWVEGGFRGSSFALGNWDTA